MKANDIKPDTVAGGSQIPQKLGDQNIFPPKKEKTRQQPSCLSPAPSRRSSVSSILSYKSDITEITIPDETGHAINNAANFQRMLAQFLASMPQFNAPVPENAWNTTGGSGNSRHGDFWHAAENASHKHATS